VPALTMGVWAEEHKQGTDELLFTLPATDIEVVLGKYVATLGIYSVSLLISLFSNIIVLAWLGSPDLGLMLGNYIGYWFMGGALIAVGMLASLLTANITIAFILGAIFCSLLVLLQPAMGILSEALSDLVETLVVIEHFDDFARGTVSFTGILYFASVAGLMIYLNVLLIGRRHWPAEADGYKMWIHHLVRSIAIVIGVISLNSIFNLVSFRLDVTAEQLHSLSSETKNLLGELQNDRPVFVQAFISKDVPQQFVQTRANLIGSLKEMDAVGGDRVQVVIHDTEPFSPEARDAREKFGITQQQIPIIAGGAGAGFKEVFMGVAFTCGAEEQVIPFFDRGLPVEYELTRSIRVVARTNRKKIGVLGTEAKLFGGFDFQSMRSSPAWPVVDELKKQYEVEQVSATSPIDAVYDALLVALPSALPQEEMDNLVDYIEQGHPTLLLIDPLTIINVGLSPSEQSGANTNPFMRNQGPPPKPKGDIHGLLTRIGVSWNKAQIVWDKYNPHPDLAHLQDQIVFVGAGNQNPESFNQEHSGSADMQELVFLYPGSVQKAANISYDFTPLIKSSVYSGSNNYSQLVQRSFFGTQLVQPRFRVRPTSIDYTLAAHVKGTTVSADSTVADSSATSSAVNLIVISDLDFISQEFFEIRKRAVANLNFDNVSFFLNCMDVLVGDESFVALRNKRVRHRTLTTVEEQKRKFLEDRNKDQQEAEGEASAALAEAQQRLNEKVNEVRQRTDLDEQTKQIMARNLQEAENRKFEAFKNNIEAEKDAKINRSKEDMEAKIRSIQARYKTIALVLPMILVVPPGVVIFIRRQKREKEGAAAAHRLRS
ncbi:Gldg family protein, partial [bacterium]|nr:Gldg family protein [bacterium]